MLIDLTESENEKDVLLDRVEMLERQMKVILPEVYEMKMTIKEFQLLKVPLAVCR